MTATADGTTAAVRGPVVILGAGGTAAAALAAVRELGVEHADVVVRDPARAADLLAAAARVGITVALVEWPAAEVVARAGLVISTVPAGAADAAGRPHPRRSTRVRRRLRPLADPAGGTAQAAGARVVGGLELLVGQAALQVEIWSGRRAPIGAMRAAGEAALRVRASGSVGKPERTKNLPMWSAPEGGGCLKQTAWPAEGIKRKSREIRVRQVR